MSSNAWEDRLGKWLRETAWVHHPPDLKYGRQLRPADFIVGWAGGWGLVEAKEVQADRFPLSNWTPSQRAHARQAISQGGAYLLAVRFAPLGAQALFDASGLTELAGVSLRLEQGMVFDQHSLPAVLAGIAAPR